MQQVYGNRSTSYAMFGDDPTIVIGNAASSPPDEAHHCSKLRASASFEWTREG